MSVSGVFNGIQYTKITTATCSKWVSPLSKFNRDLFPKFTAANKAIRVRGGIEWTWLDYKAAYLEQEATAKQRKLFA